MQSAQPAATGKALSLLCSVLAPGVPAACRVAHLQHRHLVCT